MALPFLHSLRLRSLAAFRRCSQNGRRDAPAYVGSKGCLFCSLANVSESFECDQLLNDSEAMEKDAALRLALTQLFAEFTSESQLSLRRFFKLRHAPVLSTGSLKLDLALGIGVLPKFALVREEWLKSMAGKLLGKQCLHFIISRKLKSLEDIVHILMLRMHWTLLIVESMGVNTTNLLISPPDSAEKLLSVVDTLTKSGSVDVIVVDSLAALIPQIEIDAMFGSTEDRQSRIMSQSLQKIHNSLCQSQTLIVFLNQVRFSSKSGGLGRVDEDTCGGNALKFYSAVRLRMVRTGLLKTKDKVTGLGVSVEMVKNKLAPALKKADLRIQFGSGFCCESEVLELACEYGIIMKDGTAYLIEGQVFSNESAAEKYLAENNEVLGGIVTDLRRNLFKRQR